MGSHDVDGVEIDSLVRELTEPLCPAQSKPARDPVSERRAGRWTNVRLQMPAARTVSLRARVESWTGVRLQSLPELAQKIGPPGPVIIVRFWVALGALYSLSMTFWPYPRTYWWGLEAYLLSLAMVLVAGIWGARLAWDARLGAAHTIALGSVVWAITLVAKTLPSM